MKLKSYFVDSVEEGINKARVELGPDAMLINSSETSRDLKDLGRYEVVFGVSQTDSGLPFRHHQLKADPNSVATVGNEVILRELAELRKQVESFNQSAVRSNLSRLNPESRPETAEAENRLLSVGFSSELARQLSDAIASRVEPQPDKAHRMTRDHHDLFARDLRNAVLEEEIASRFGVEPSLGQSGGVTSTVMFVGPPGAGKTSSMVKLGLQYGLRARRPLRFLSLDTLRIGGCEQLNSYARIGGLDFRPLRDVSDLETAVSSLTEKELTLIDTAGFSKAGEDEAEDLARATRQLPIEVHLVIPAFVSLPAAQRIWQRFAMFKPSKLLVTHVDSVEQPATLAEFAIRSGLPLSFLGTGQQVPEDIRKASKAELLADLAPRELAVSMAAA